jgi:HlyD family secretion protein
MADDIIPVEPQQVVLAGKRVPVRAPELKDSPQDAIRIGLGIAIFFFVILLGWAAVARLDAAAYGEGQIAVSGNRQTIQHREGGIIQSLNVKEGQHVNAGQILMKLQGADVAANERALAGSVIDLIAQRARLEAEIRGTQLAWPPEFRSFSGDDRLLAERAMNLQTRLMAARSSALANSRSVLAQQAAGIASTSTGFAAQARANEQQRRSLEAQLESTRKLAEEGFASTNTIRTIERQIQALRGETADYSARVAASRAQVGQAREEAVGATRKYVEDSAQTLNTTQFQINEAMPKWISAKQELERTIIRAPASGRVVGLRYFSVGGVINPGVPILDLVPDKVPLVIKANFSPTDIDGVQEGKAAEVKFLSMHERDLPILLGKISNVSADSLKDEQSGRSYFTAEVTVPEEQIAILKSVRKEDLGIRPGVPVSVVVKLRKRTALQYFLEPLLEAFSRSFHER